MSDNPFPDVLVVGAGPTGLLTACELARRGLAVRLVDQASTPFHGSRGKGLQPRTLEALDNVGVADRLIALGRFRLPLRFYDAAGGHQDLDPREGQEPTPDNPYARSLLLPQWQVEAALRACLAEHGVAVEWNRGVAGLTQEPEGVRVAFGDNSVVTARYVVGCDGGSSTVRRLAGIAFVGTTTEEERMLLGDVRLDGLDRDFWHMWQTPAGSVALCPLPATDTFQIQAPLAPGSTDEPSLATFQAIVDAVVGPERIRLRELVWHSRWRLNVRLVERYRAGRVLLAGDAAHIHSPAGGQGMNTGLQDAANLGWKLAAVLRGAPETLLDTYETERRPVAAAVLALSSKLLGQHPGARSADERQQLLQLGVSYRGGPLAPLAEGPGPQAGDRAPDAPCTLPDGRRRRLFEVQRGGQWILYGFGVQPASPHPSVQTIHIGVDLLDGAGYAQQAYAAQPGDLVLVRPDGHIGLRSRDETVIKAYLASVLGPTKAG